METASVETEANDESAENGVIVEIEAIEVIGNTDDDLALPETEALAEVVPLLVARKTTMPAAGSVTTNVSVSMLGLSETLDAGTGTEIGEEEEEGEEAMMTDDVGEEIVMVAVREVEMEVEETVAGTETTSQWAAWTMPDNLDEALVPSNLGSPLQT